MTIERRVSARYILAISSPKEALKTFDRYAARLKSLVGAEKFDEAALLYREMADQLHPMALAARALRMERSDEKRKLENLKKVVRTIELATGAAALSDYAGDQLGRWILRRLEDLEAALRSLVRMGDRLEQYHAIEKTFKHGPYTIENRHGYRADEYAEPLTVLDAATEMVQRAGFGDAAYGAVVLESGNAYGRGYAGIYHMQSDSIGLHMEAKNRFNAVYTLVHELGHRVWHKRLTEQQRDVYETRYYGTATRAITLAERETMWAALQRAEFNPRKVSALLPEGLRTIWSAYWAERKKATGVFSPLRGIEAPSMETLYRNFVLPKQRFVVLDDSIKSVTDYGKTNVKEDFAEIFAHYCTGKPLTEDAERRFREATGA